MKHTAPFLSLLFTLSFLGCGDDDAGGGRALALGESVISLELSGGGLPGMLIFRGKTEEIGSFYHDDISLLASSPIGVWDASEEYMLEILTFRVAGLDAGTYGTDDFAINLVVEGFLNEHGTTAYSLRARDDTGAVEIVSASSERVRLRFEFDASPTQHASTNLVFHLKGELDVRD